MVFKSTVRNMCLGGLVVFMTGCGGGGSDTVVPTVPEKFEALEVSDSFAWEPSVDLTLSINVNSARDAVLTIKAGENEIFKGLVSAGATVSQEISVPGTEEGLTFTLEAFGKSSTYSSTLEDLQINPTVSLELQTVENYNEAETQQAMAGEGV